MDRLFVIAVISALVAVAAMMAPTASASAAISAATPAPGAPIPIIIDSDIGDDFDDSWALAEAILSADIFDVRMFMTAAHDTVKRAQIVAKYLTLYNRTDIPIAIGVKTDDHIGNLYPWAADYNISSYAGEVFDDGVAAAASLILDSREPITIIGLAPFTNMESMGRRFPQTIGRVDRIVAMGGAFYKCYGDAPTTPGACPEYNVAENVTATQFMFNQSWPITLTPLDTCDLQINGSAWEQIVAGNTTQHKVLQIVLETYCLWDQYSSGCLHKSDTIYDATAVWLAWNQTLFNMDQLSVRLNDKGSTYIAANGTGKLIDVALTWHPNGEAVYTSALAGLFTGTYTPSIGGLAPTAGAKLAPVVVDSAGVVVESS